MNREIVVVLVVLFCLTNYPVLMIPHIVNLQTAQQDYTVHENIVIMNDESFNLLGFPGSGTELDPYIIEGLWIEGEYNYALTIQNTDKHVIIRNCYFKSEDGTEYYPSGTTVYFSDVAHVTIESNKINFAEDGIRLDNSNNCTINDNEFQSESRFEYPRPPNIRAISMISASNCSILNNQIKWVDFGIESHSTYNCTYSGNDVRYSNEGIYFRISANNTIEENDVYNNERGLSLLDTESCIVRDNWIIDNVIGIFLEESSDRFYLNRFGNDPYDIMMWELPVHGTFGIWDDGNGSGNWWQKYNGTGPYLIPNLNQTYDMYPMILDGDFIGPEIELEQIGIFEAQHMSYKPSFTIKANISDISSVDTVLLWIENGETWFCIELNQSQIDGNLNLYTYTIDRSFSHHWGVYGLYYIWANDSNGNYRESGVTYYAMGSVVPLIYDPVGLVTITAISGIITLIACIISVSKTKKEGKPTPSKTTVVIYGTILFLVLFTVQFYLVSSTRVLF